MWSLAASRECFYNLRLYRERRWYTQYVVLLERWMSEENLEIERVRMAEAKVTWINEGKFLGEDSSKHSVVLSTQDENNAIGMRPSELLLVSLASCTAVDVVNILQKKRKKLSSLEIEAHAEQDPEPPWPYRKIHLTFHLWGDDLTPKDVEQAIALSEGKYCSISATLRPQVDLSTSFELHLDGK